MDSVDYNKDFGRDTLQVTTNLDWSVQTKKEIVRIKKYTF